jgi:hypothetical protein
LKSAPGHPWPLRRRAASDRRIPARRIPARRIRQFLLAVAAMGGLGILVKAAT